MKPIHLLTFLSTALLPFELCCVPVYDLLEEQYPEIEDMTANGMESPSAIPMTYPISKITVEYDQTHPKHIPLSKIEALEMHLYESDGVFYGDDREDAVSTYRTIGKINRADETLLFSQSAIEAVVREVYNCFIGNDMHWTVAYIPTSEISKSGEDLRSNSDLTIMVSSPVVESTAVKIVSAKNSSKEINNSKLSQKIEDGLPLSLPDPSSGYPGDYINSNALNNYLHALNRHPERRVDLEIGPTNVPGQVALDFVVTQRRPFYFYANVNNNVPKAFKRWQESVGFIHTQLSGNDDILKLNASSDSIDKFYSVDASYEAPIGRSLKNRWQIYGNFNRFLSAEFALPQNLFVGTQAIGNLEFISNVAQWGRLFLDVVADLQYRHIHNKSHFLFGDANKNFLLPAVGLKCIQLKRESKLIASLSFQSTISSLFWNVGKNLDNLGRFDLSKNWGIVEASVYGSFYLEPLFQKRSAVRHLAHEMVCMGQLQNAFNQRLIPQLEGILGGLYTIRGYPQSTVSGDNLYMGSVEYRFHLPAALKINPNSTVKVFGKPLRWAPGEPKGPTDWDLIFRAFYDVGETTVNQKKRFERNHLIMGTGLGLELIVWSNVFIRGDWGRALRSANGISSGNDQFYFSSTIIF